jgi:hypothetical protein
MRLDLEDFLVHGWDEGEARLRRPTRLYTLSPFLRSALNRLPLPYKTLGFPESASTLVNVAVEAGLNRDIIQEEFVRQIRGGEVVHNTRT